MNYRLCAFADEADQLLTGQIAAMQRNGIHLLEIRGVDGENISVLTPAKVKEVAHLLTENGIAVWSIGSPTGKVKLSDNWDAHVDSFKGMLVRFLTHGQPHYVLIQIFYQGVNEAIRARLDLATNCKFIIMDPSLAWDLVERLTCHDARFATSLNLNTLERGLYEVTP